MAEGCFSLELTQGHAFYVSDQAAMYVVHFLKYLGYREILFLFCLECVEGVYTTIAQRVTWRPSAFKNERQMLERLFFPCSNVRQDVSHGPFASHARCHQLRFRQVHACLLKFAPSLVKSFQEPSSIHN